MTELRLGPIGSHESVPPRQIESEIIARLKVENRMMYPVHVRSNHEQAYYSVSPYRDKQITVIKHGSAV